MKANLILPLVTSALAPTEAILRAEYERQLTRQCETVLSELAADGWDASKRYGFPSSSEFPTRKAYSAQRRRYDLANAYTTGISGRSFRDPDTRMPKPDNAQRIGERAAKLASEALSGFCGKLAGKIAQQAEAPGAGEVETVKYTGGIDPWSWSYVDVKAGASVQRWQTKMIVNVSCLGKVFNQWPTRLI